MHAACTKIEDGSNASLSHVSRSALAGRSRDLRNRGVPRENLKDKERNKERKNERQRKRESER